MSIVVSRYGIGVLYRCFNLTYRYSWFKKCPDDGTMKCVKCKYAKAELSGEDATRLMDSFGTNFIENRKGRKMKFIAEENWLLPKRATRGSAGYDFVLPHDVSIPPMTMIAFDTGVRIEGMPSTMFMQIVVRSSIGRMGITLGNSVAIIDSDYKENIHGFLFNTTKWPVDFKKGERIMQGIFLDYYTVEDDMVTAERNGGIGSTGK